MEIQNIIVPVTEQPENAVMRRYSLYFADKLKASLLRQKAMDNVGPGHLTVLPFGEQLQLPNFKLEKYLTAAEGPVLFCPDHYLDIESIALAYDGSENAKRALDLAVWLSDKATWPLSVLMVADSQDEGVRWMDEVEVYLDSLTINSTTIILSGEAGKALCRFMREGSVELLIMGTCGNRANSFESMGHTAAYLLEQADFPLLMVS